MTILNRSVVERRSGRDRRKKVRLSGFFYKGLERRALNDRRSLRERRYGWLRTSKWSSVYYSNPKITKHLR